MLFLLLIHYPLHFLRHALMPNDILTVEALLTEFPHISKFHFTKIQEITTNLSCAHGSKLEAHCDLLVPPAEIFNVIHLKKPVLIKM